MVRLSNRKCGFLFVATSKRVILCALLFISYMVSHAVVPDEMTIVVEGPGFRKQAFQNGDSLWLDRKYVIEQLPETSALKGFEFLKSKCNTDEAAVIVPENDGSIYVLAKNNASIAGWTKVDNSVFYYDSGKTAMAVFAKTVLKGERISLPSTGDFQGTSPLAKNISYMDPEKIDEMKIIVEEESETYAVKTLRENTTLFLGLPVYNLENIPEDFDGYKFLSGSSGQLNTGIIIPSKDGRIYVIAPRGGLAGWTAVENTVMYSDYTCDETCVYQRAVLAGERIAIPRVDNVEGVSPLAKEIELHTLNPTPPDEMEVTVKAEEGVFQKRTFENGACLFLNRTYVAGDIPERFAGYEFLASNGAEQDEAGSHIIPSSDGYIYLIAKSGLDIGASWSIIPNSEFYYSDTNNTRISIFRQEVTAGSDIVLPESGTDFRGLTPLAKTIKLETMHTGTDNQGVVLSPNLSVRIGYRKLYVEQEAPAEFAIVIADMMGRIWYKKTNVAFEEMNLYSWPDGIYLISIRQNNHQYTTKVILK